MTYVPARGPLGAQLMILTDNPNYNDVNSGQLLSGSDGKELDRLLNNVGLGINRSNVWISSVVKEFVQPNLFGQKKIPFKQRCANSGVDFDKYLIELREEINQINPNCILALGGAALWSLTGKFPIVDYRGSILYGLSHKVVGTYHPRDLIHSNEASEMSDYYNRQIMMFDIKRAIEESKFPEYVLPQRLLNICENSFQLSDFVERKRFQSKMSVDIENKEDCIPACIGIACDKYEGLTIPLWNEGNISTIPTGDLVQCWIILAKLLVEKDIIGQNFGYDRDKIKRLGFIIRKLISDTMYKAFLLNPELPKSLAFNTSIHTREPFYKNEGMYEGLIKDLFIGCARDACVTYEVDESQSKDLDQLGLTEVYDQFYIKLHDLYLNIENNGLLTDETIRLKLLGKYIKERELTNYKIFKLAGDVQININSWKQVDVFLYESLKIPRRKGTGEEVLTQALNSGKLTDLQKSAIGLVLSGRQVNKTIDNYLMSPPDFDGRTRTSYFPCLNTGRSSTNQQEPPIRPLQVVKIDGKTKKKALGTAFQTMTKHGEIGADIRTQFIPDEGEVFVQIDSSQAEARVIFKLANDEQALIDIDSHDYHALTASWFFGGTEDTHSKKVLGYESPIRFTGKTLRHACHLGASKRRAAISVNTDARKYKVNITITERQAEEAIQIFHRKQPKIREVFHYQIIECIQRTRKLESPIPYGVNAPHGAIRTFYDRMGEDLYRQAFGEIPQRTISENTKGAAMRIRERAPWIKILIESHDSLLVSMPIDRLTIGVPIMKEEMERPINFENCSLSRGILIVPSEVEIGYNYKELKKYKG